MGILITKVEQSTQILTAKKFVGIYLFLNNTKYNDRDLTVLSYYCLHGVSDTVDALIAKEYFGHLKEIRMAKQLVSNIKLKLKKYRLLDFDELYRVYSVTKELQSVFRDSSKLGYMINFTLTTESPSQAIAA